MYSIRNEKKMNIVFEGVTGAGKTSIIKELVKIMEENNMTVHNISEIEDVSPLSEVIRKMYNSDTFLRMNEPIDTVITESLILAADYQYMKEYTKNLQGYIIFDRDIFTEIVYQKYFLEKRYGIGNLFFENWKNCITYEPKVIDIIFWVEVPEILSITRNELRDKRNFTYEQRKILKDLAKLQKSYIEEYCKSNDVKLVMLDGTKPIEENSRYVYEILKGVENYEL